MRAWYINRYGGGDVLEHGEQPEPEPGADDVLIEVRAASVNPIDWKTRSGKLKVILKYALPQILGSDLSGEVVAVGERVTAFKVGDAVFTRPDKLRIGAFAERIAVRADEVARKPERLSHEQAASLPLVGLTTWQALVELAQVAAGDHVLIHAGAGGVGTFAIQLAKHLGATVSTTASAAKHDLVRRLGADRAIDYRSHDFAQELSGCAAVFDTLGGDALARSFDVVAPRGIVISIAGPPDPELARERGMPLPMRLGVRALSWSVRRRARNRGARYRFLLMRSSGEQLAEIGALVDAGTIEPVIDRVYGFDHADEAVAYAERGHATGKVVITRDPANVTAPSGGA